MTEKSDGNAADFAADLAALRQEVAHLAGSVSDLVRSQTRAAGVRISEAVREAGNKLASTAACERNSVRVVRGEIEERIEHNPLMSVLIALAVGVSIGLISRSRH